MKKKLKFLLFLFTLFAVNGFSQETSKTAPSNIFNVPDSLPQHVITNYSTEQVEIYHSNAITISFHVEDCYIKESGMNKEKVFLTFINNTSQDIIFSYYVKKWRNGVLINNTPDSPDFLKKVTIPANSSKEGYCGIDAPRSLEIFSLHLDFPKNRLTGFSLTNLGLTTVNQ